VRSANERAFAGHGGSAARWYASQPHWWPEHFGEAVDEALSELASSGVTTTGARLLDVGCGDGIITLGLARRGGFASVTGMDIVGVDTDFLDAEAKVHNELPIGPEDHLTFVRSEPDVIPFPDGCFDVVTAWSVFEHVTEPRKLLREIYRVLRPGGVIFIQVWPLWSSENGSHLWPFFDEGFVHLTHTPEEIRTVLHEKLVDPELAESMFAMYESCNRKTVDQIQRALIQTGFHFGKVKLTGASVHVPPALQEVPFSQLAIDGFTIIAARPTPVDEEGSGHESG
jgi:SAM-dependent methyltransferase